GSLLYFRFLPAQRVSSFPVITPVVFIRQSGLFLQPLIKGNFKFFVFFRIFLQANSFKGCLKCLSASSSSCCRTHRMCMNSSAELHNNIPSKNRVQVRNHSWGKPS